MVGGGHVAMRSMHAGEVHWTILHFIQSSWPHRTFIPAIDKLCPHSKNDGPKAKHKLHTVSRKGPGQGHLGWLGLRQVL
jgi:predicted transcriptional regulator with HTH domain